MQTNTNTQNPSSAKVQIVPRARNELKNPSTYDEFILWFALPGHEKQKMGLEFQDAFAAYHGITPKTLSTWKRRPDFLPSVHELRTSWAKERTSDVIAAIYKSSLKGNDKSQKLWMQLFEGFTEKTEVEKKETVEVGVNDIRFIIEALPEPHKTKFNGYIDEIISVANSIRNARDVDEAVWNERPTYTVRDEANNDAQEFSDNGTDGMAESNQTSIRRNMVRTPSASDNQSTSRWWKKQTAGDDWV